MYIHAIIWACLVCYVSGQAATDLINLKTELFTTNAYNKNVRPVIEQASAVDVTVDFALVGINSFSDTDQKLTTTGYLTLKWTDDLLVWTPATYNGLTSILVPQDKIWQPDITLENGMESKEGLGQEFIQMTITSGGVVTWTPYEVFETECSVDIAHFPFDTQTCNIKFITWMNEKEQVSLDFGTDGFYTSNFEKNGKWEIQSMESSREVTTTKTILTFTLNLKRRPSFYILFLILPATLLSLLNAFVFVLPASSEEKIVYSVAVFLSYALFYTILSTSLPKNSDTVSTVAAYLFFMMFLSTLACVITVIELRVYHKQTTDKLPKRLVNIVKFILYKRCFCDTSCCSKTVGDEDEDEPVEGEWTKVIGPWLDCDWKDAIDALDFVLFWLFLIVTIVCAVLAFLLSSNHVSLF